MDVMHERVAGLDVHKATIVACVPLMAGGKVSRECRHRRLSPMQLAYLMGLPRAKVQAQREMDEMADEFEGVLAEIHAEMRGVRELARLRTLDDAILAERDAKMCLK